MKKTILFIIFAMLFLQALAQEKYTIKSQDTFRVKSLYNAYGVAKEILKIERRLRNVESVPAMTQDTIITLLGAMNWYANLQDEDDISVSKLQEKLTTYSRLNDAFINIIPYIYNLAFLEFNTLDDARNFFVEKKLTNEFEATLKNFPLLHSYFAKKQTIARHEQEKKTRSDRLTVLEKDYLISISGLDSGKIIELRKIECDSSAAKLYKDLDTSNGNWVLQIESSLKNDTTSLNKICVETKLIDLYKTKLLDIENLITQDNKSIVDEKKTLIAKFKKNPDSTLTKLLSSTGKNDYVKAIQVDEDIAISQTAYYFSKETVLQTANNQTGFSLNMPTESEMIEAVAIYLAKRVKQESVMWFFETIQKNASEYSLIKTFFPNTITLLQSNEVYDIPNLGAQWRYALSKDFIKMPKNVFSSDWFQKWYYTIYKDDPNMVDILEFLKAAYDACDLLSQQYSYSELVKQMYINLQNQEASIGKISASTVFAVLYAFNQECYIPIKYPGTDSVQTRLMGYEDFRNVSKDELEIMVSLMDMKYSQAFTPIWKDDATRQFLGRNNAETFRRWAGSIEAGIEQFSKLQMDYVKTTTEIKEGKKIDASYSILNMWENVDKLINIVLPDSTWNDTMLRKVAKSTKYVKQQLETTFEIYNQISLKNYAGAVNTTISLVEEIIYKNNKYAKIDTELLKIINNSISGNDEIIEIYGNKLKTYEIVISPKIAGVENIKVQKNLSLKDSSKLIKVIISKGVVEVNYGKNISFTENTKGGNLIISSDNKINCSSDSSLIVTNENKLLQFKQTDAISSYIFDQDRRAINLIRKLAGFLNDVMLAADAKQLSKIVESYAMPPGSYKRKRNSWFSADLNAYAGVYGGFETPEGKTNNLAGVIGVTVPIGLSFSWTTGKELSNNDSLTEDLIRNPYKLRFKRGKIEKRTKSTFTTVLTVVDLGSVVAYRFGGTDKENIQQGFPKDLKWTQLFSPGVRIGWGIPSTPLILSLGYQYTPELRAIDKTGIQTQVSTNRISFGLLFDLPLVNLWQL